MKKRNNKKKNTQSNFSKLSIFQNQTIPKNVEVILRINSIRSLFGLDDIRAILSTDFPPPAIMLPKVNDAEEVKIIDDLLNERGHNCELHPIIETNAGLEKVYEIGRVFRNEWVDFYHNPEFTMLESYQAFADYNDMMIMVEEMISSVADEIYGTKVLEFNGTKIDFTPPWPRLDLRETIKEFSGIDYIENLDIDSLSKEMKRLGIDVDKQVSWGGMMDKLISSKVEPNLIQPSFLVDYPISMSPLAKKK